MLQSPPLTSESIFHTAVWRKNTKTSAMGATKKSDTNCDKIDLQNRSWTKIYKSWTFDTQNSMASRILSDAFY